MTRQRWLLVSWICLLGLTTAAYWPGLSGGFLFDDFVNLDALGATGPVDNWPTFWRYITSGNADPTGRPLALLSFLLDARDWPADAAAFLRTNLILHLLNGCFLFMLLRQLGRALQSAPTVSDAAALLGAGLWLLHPLLVSTTLYIVQREAMLPTTFTLLGLLAYGRGRLSYRNSEGANGAVLMTVGIVGGTGLALLCKGNGILVPLLAWVLEFTIFSQAKTGQSEMKTDRRLQILTWTLLIAPSCLIFAYLIQKLTMLNVPLGTRPWTIGERLLTEPRVVIDYLQLLVVPRSVSTGLYNDAYLVSTSLWKPASTMPAIAIMLALISSGFAFRRASPRFSAALLFFFAGHILESTVIPLELYFEHRNYLPAMLLFWPLANGLCNLKASRTLRVAVASGLLMFMALTTYHRSALWGQPNKLLALWAIQNPGSARAQASVGMALMNSGESQRAAEHLRPLWLRRPSDIQLAFNYIDAQCRWRGIPDSDKSRLAETLRTAKSGDLLIHQWLARTIEVAASSGCSGLELADVEEWIASAALNPRISPVSVQGQTIEPLIGQLAVRQGQPRRALRHFNRSLASFTDPNLAARNITYLARAGFYKEALAHLDFYETLDWKQPRPVQGMPWLHSKVLQKQDYWPREMAILRAKLLEEIAAEGKTP